MNAYDSTHGWGFTLKNTEDWQFNKMQELIPTKNFKISYGKDGTGWRAKLTNVFGCILIMINRKYYACRKHSRICTDD